MQKFIFDLLQIAIVVRMGYFILRWAVKSTKSYKKSIVGKVIKLVSNRIHYRLDNALKKQKKKLYPSVEHNNVVPFKKTN